MSLFSDIQDLMDQLEIPGLPGLIDPGLANLANSAGSAAPPGLPEPTGDPNRYTVLVPFDATILSLGQACPTRIDDRGVTTKTNEHTHFSVTGATDATDRTIVALGGPTTSFVTDQFTGTGSVWPIDEHHGYALVTDGNAVHDVKLSHHILSRDLDIAIRTTGPSGDDDSETPNQIVIQSDTGPVTIQGGNNVTVGTAKNLTLSAWSNADIPDFWNSPKSGGFWVAKTGTYFALALITIKGCKDLFTSWSQIFAKPTPGVPGWAPVPATDKIATVITTALTLGTITQAVADWSNTAGADWAGVGTGNVSVTAEKYGALLSGVASTVYGTVGSFLYSSGSAEVLGLLNGSVTGIGTASVAGGLSASVGALGNVKVSSELLETAVEGNTGVSVSSKLGEARVQGQLGATMNAVTGPAVLHGMTKAYVGAGPTGYGMVAEPLKLSLGYIPTAGVFSTAAVNPTQAIEFTPQAIKATSGPCSLSLGIGGDFSGQGVMVTLSATGPAKFNASVLLLG